MSNYPERPMNGVRPKKPGHQRKRPSSEKSSGGKRKSYLSDGSVMLTNAGPRLIRMQFPWFQSPARKAERLKRQKSLWPNKGRSFA